MRMNRKQRRAGLKQGEWAAQRRAEAHQGAHPKKWDQIDQRARVVDKRKCAN